MPLGFGPISSYPISAPPYGVRPAPTAGKLRQQYYRALAELPRAPSVGEWFGEWLLILNAVGEAIPGRPRKVDPGLEYLAEVVVTGVEPTAEQYKEAHLRAQAQLEDGKTVTVGAIRKAWAKARK